MNWTQNAGKQYLQILLLSAYGDPSSSVEGSYRKCEMFKRKKNDKREISWGKDRIVTSSLPK